MFQQFHQNVLGAFWSAPLRAKAEYLQLVEKYWSMFDSAWSTKLSAWTYAGTVNNQTQSGSFCHQHFHQLYCSLTHDDHMMITWWSHDHSVLITHLYHLMSTASCLVCCREWSDGCLPGGRVCDCGRRNCSISYTHDGLRRKNDKTTPTKQPRLPYPHTAVRQPSLHYQILYHSCSVPAWRHSKHQHNDTEYAQNNAINFS